MSRIGTAVIFLILIIGGVTFLWLRHPAQQGLRKGSRSPAFAIPLLGSRLTGDANLVEQKGDTHWACKVQGKDILNGCVLRNRGRVLVGFFVGDGKSCLREIGVLQAFAVSQRIVLPVVVVSKTDRKRTQLFVKKNRWSLLIGYDRDGALANRFRVAVCPQITYIGHDGNVQGTFFGRMNLTKLKRKVNQFLQSEKNL